MLKNAVEMNGKELFEKYTESPNEYARTLFTAYNIEGANLFTLLEKAESEGKKIAINYPEINGPSEGFVIIE